MALHTVDSGHDSHIFDIALDGDFWSKHAKGVEPLSTGELGIRLLDIARRYVIQRTYTTNGPQRGRFITPFSPTEIADAR